MSGPTQRAAELTTRYLDAIATVEEVRELEALLREDEGARVAFLNETRLTDGLRLLVEPGAARARAARGRTIRIFAPLAAAAAVLLAVGAFVFLREAPPAPPAGSAYAKAASPGVKLLRAGATLPITPGTRFQPGDRIDTGPDGSLTVAYAGEATEVELRQETVCQLGFLTSPSKPNVHTCLKHLYLDAGGLSGSIARQPKDHAMTFDTPHGMATLLGTRVRMSSGMRFARLDVDEGLVRLQRTHDNDSVIVPPGHYAVISDGDDPVAIPAAVPWEEFSRLRKQRTDGPVIRKDDFEGGDLAGWEPTLYSGDLSRPLGPRKEAAQIVEIADEERGRTRVLRLLSPVDDHAAAGVLLPVAADFESLCLEGDLQVPPGPVPRLMHRAGMTKPHGTAIRVLHETKAEAGAPLGKATPWKHFRVEYTRDKPGPGPDAVDVKGFLDGRLVRWERMEGNWSGFAPHLYFFAASGELLLDNLVLRQRLYGRVSDGLMAAYRFDEGKGTTVRDEVPGGDALNLSVAAPAYTRWVPGALWVTGPAQIACPIKDKLTRAWNRTGGVTFEFWIAIDESLRAEGYKYAVFDLVGKWGSFNYTQDYRPSNVRSTTPRPRHFVVIFQREGDAANMIIYADGKLDYSRKFDGLGRVLSESPFRFQLPGGERKHTPAKILPWTGGYYYLAIFDRLLTPEEVLRNRHCGPPED